MKCVHILMNIPENGPARVTIVDQKVYFAAKAAAAGISFMHWKELAIQCMKSNVYQLKIGVIAMQPVTESDSVLLAQGSVDALRNAGLMTVFSGRMKLDLDGVKAAEISTQSEMFEYFSRKVRESKADLN